MRHVEDGGLSRQMDLSDLGKQVDDIFQKGMNSQELESFRNGIDSLIKDVRTWTVDNVSQYKPKEPGQNGGQAGRVSGSGHGANEGHAGYSGGAGGARYSGNAGGAGQAAYRQNNSGQYAGRRAVQDNMRQQMRTQRERAQYRRQEMANYVHEGKIKVRQVPRANPVNLAPTVARMPGNVSGVLLTVFGSIGAFSFGLPVFIVWLVGMVNGYSMGMATAMSVLFPFAAVSAGMLWGGVRKLRFNGRFRKYLRAIGGKAYCTVRELANAVGKTERFVLKDIQKLMNKRLLLQAHMDDQRTCLILTDEMYKTYMETQLNARQMQLEEKERQRRLEIEEEKKQQMSAEEASVQSVIEEGRGYIRQLKEANDAIAGEEVSEKLYRLETIITKIFDHVQKNPKTLPEIRKFIEYYMPTTLKLVNAYREFDAQPIQGDNIVKSKREIESTLDTINEAFTNLFDSLYEDVAMDISTDISVLQTMLAQEGLTGKDFDRQD